MRLGYYLSDDIDDVTAIDFLNFLNAAYKIPEGKPDIIDVYLSSNGGSAYSYSVIKNAMETSEIPIQLIGVGGMHSAAFLLLYFTDNVFKSMNRYSHSVLHTLTISHDDRALRNPTSYETINKEELNRLNDELVVEIKKNKILSPADLKLYLSGRDVTLSYDKLYKVMLKCPYGKFLKEEEILNFEK